MTYLHAKQPDKALPLFEQVISAQRSRAKPDSAGFARGLAQVSDALLQYHQHPAAELYLRECLTIREKTMPGHWLVYNTKSMLGAALLGQDKFEQAEPLLIEGYQGLKEREADIPGDAKVRLTEALQRLIDLAAVSG